VFRPGLNVDGLRQAFNLKRYFVLAETFGFTRHKGGPAEVGLGFVVGTVAEISVENELAFPLELSALTT
jgi:hypothetical protein